MDVDRPCFEMSENEGGRANTLSATKIAVLFVFLTYKIQNTLNTIIISIF